MAVYNQWTSFTSANPFGTVLAEIYADIDGVTWDSSSSTLWFDDAHTSGFTFVNSNSMGPYINGTRVSNLVSSNTVTLAEYYAKENGEILIGFVHLGSSSVVAIAKNSDGKWYAMQMNIANANTSDPSTRSVKYLCAYVGATYTYSSYTMLQNTPTMSGFIELRNIRTREDTIIENLFINTWGVSQAFQKIDVDGVKYITSGYINGIYLLLKL